MKFVYILQDVATGEHLYTGVTEDVQARLAKHNAGDVSHTAKFRPWKLRTFVAFTDDALAVAFERYLKSGSGRAFARKRL